MNNSNNIESLIAIPEIWQNHVFNCLTLSEIKTMKLVSKVFSQMIDVEFLWKDINNRYFKIKLPSPLLYKQFIPNLVIGTLSINTDMNSGGSFSLRGNNFDFPLIRIAAYTNRGFRICRSDKLKKEFCFGITWERKLKNRQISEEDINNALACFPYIKAPFPVSIPVKYIRNKKEKDVILLKINDQIFQLTCIQQQDTNQDEIYSKFHAKRKKVIDLSTNDYWKAYNREFKSKPVIDRSLKSTFIDLDSDPDYKSSKEKGI